MWKVFAVLYIFAYMQFRDVIRQQADILKQAVREQKTYQPFEWKGAGEQTECI